MVEAEEYKLNMLDPFLKNGLEQIPQNKLLHFVNIVFPRNRLHMTDTK